jgi:hypothetical protein
VKLTSVAIFAVGYVIGSRAGRERYAQIVDAVERTSQRLEAFSARHAPDRRHEGSGRAGGDA